MAAASAKATAAAALYAGERQQLQAHLRSLEEKIAETQQETTRVTTHHAEVVERIHYESDLRVAEFKRQAELLAAQQRTTEQADTKRALQDAAEAGRLDMIDLQGEVQGEAGQYASFTKSD